MQISARCVLPVTSTSRLRNSRSTSHGGGAAPRRARAPAPARSRARRAVVARLVDARRLAGRADEQAGEQVGQRRMVLPVGDAGSAAGRAGAGTGCRPGVAPPSTMWLPPPVPVWRPSSMNFSAPSRRLPRLLVERRGDRRPLAPARGRMDVDLDHAGVGRDLDDVEARIGRRRIAFDVHRQADRSAAVSSTAATSSR